MNEMHVIVSFDNRVCKIAEISEINNDYNSTKLVFDFDKEYDGVKMVEIRPFYSNSKDAIFVKEIEDNEVVLTNTDEHGNNYPVFTEYGEHLLEVTLYGDNSKMTLIAEHPFYVTEEEIGISNLQAEPYLPVFDQMMNRLVCATNEANNLNVDVSKEGNVATLSVTKKDGTELSVEVHDGQDGEDGSDGKGIEYDWDGTSLGVKREDEQEYEYVNLKGEDGSCNFATFEINLSTGNLEMNKTEDMLLEFGIENSYLYVEI